MELKQLLYFVTIVDEGNITSAAKKLFMSQPPLSLQIKVLEQELGCVLMERGSRKIKLTESGKTLYKYATAMLDMSKIAKEEVKYAEKKDSGTIRLGIVSSLACSYISKWPTKYMEINKNIFIEIFEGNTYDIISMLNAGKVHMAIIRTPFNDKKLIQNILCEDNIIAVGNKNFFDENKEITLKYLSELPLIIYRRWEHIITKMFDENDLPHKYRIISDDARTTIHFTEKGLGVGLVPKSVAMTLNSNDIICRNIQKCTINSQIILAYNENAYLPRYAKNFYDYISNENL